MIVGCAVGNLVSVTPVLNGTFGIFLGPVTYALGWSRTQFSAVLLVMAIVGVGGYPIAGRLADRYGVRPVALIGNVVFALCVAGLAVSSKDRALTYALYALAGLAGTLSSCLLLMKPISLWFPRHQGLLFAVTGAFGINIGIALMPFLAKSLLADHGWRETYVALGALTFLVGFPAMALLRDPALGKAFVLEAGPALPGLTLREARQHPAFWLLMGSVSLGAGSLSAMLTHMVPLLTDRGVSLNAATSVFATTALCNASWQIVIGAMLDRTGSPRFAGAFLIAAIIGLMLIGFAVGSTWLFVGAVLIGIGSGTEYGLLPCVIPRYFGVRSFSEIYGTIFGVSVLVSGFTPVLMGLAYDMRGNYDLALVLIGGALLCSALLLIVMPSYRPLRLAGRSTDAPGDTRLAAMTAH
ncbi:MFS transporter [Sphingomonas bacterium]|uniref:MFS transporter n=1 Tax=Sphingomonas bacterium TaxID=1895847 RepID=UPI0015768F80|nr:MFS transporter [Sphingomonas bacterium]